MGTITKRPAGGTDHQLWDGTVGNKTFTAATSTGRTMTLRKLGYRPEYDWTAQFGDIITKGPWVDVRAFGASGSEQSTTGSMSAGSKQLTLAAAKDFENGQGIRVVGAGSAGADLVATIESGEGTTTLTLDTAASTTVSGANVYHDDTQALQNAVNSAGSNAHTMFLAAGVYIISSTITLPSNFALLGSGPSSKIQLFSADGLTSVLSATDKSNILIQSLTLDGNKGASGNEHGHCVNLLGSSHVTVVDSILSNPRGDCVYVGKGTSNAYCSDIHVERCQLIDPYRNCLGIVSVVGFKVTASDLTKSDSTYAACIDVETNNDATTYIKDVYVDNCTFYAPSTPGVWVVNYPDAAMDGHLASVHLTNNYIKDASYFVRYRQEVSDISLIGNHAPALSDRFITGYSDDPANNRLFNLVLRSNKIGSQASSSNIVNADNVTIEGNQWSKGPGASVSAFYCNDVTNLIVSGNSFKDYSSTYGAFYLFDTNYYTITGNIIRGANYGIVLDQNGATGGTSYGVIAHNVIQATGRAINFDATNPHTNVKIYANQYDCPRDVTNWNDSNITGYESDLAVLDRFGSAQTSGTGEDDLQSVVIKQYSLDASHCIRVYATGRKTGSAGNKIIKLYLGTDSVTVFPAANNTNTWRLDARICQDNNVNAQKVYWEFNDGGTVTNGYDDTWAQDNSAGDLTLKITGECEDAADVIYNDIFIVERM